MEEGTPPAAFVALSGGGPVDLGEVGTGKEERARKGRQPRNSPLAIEPLTANCSMHMG